MALMEITIIPMGTGTTSCSPYIARVLDIAEADPKVSYALNPMGTTLEGELGDLYHCLQNMQEALFDDGIPACLHCLQDRRPPRQVSGYGPTHSISEGETT